MTAEVRFPNYRAPQNNRQILCVPPWNAIRQMLFARQELAGQRDAVAASAVEILGVPLVDLARDARRDLVAQALAYTRSYTEITETNAETNAETDTGNDTGNDTDAETSDGPLILTGHQPELIHPGVWLKTFAASQLAQQTGGMAINLVIDNDLCRVPSVRVPTGSVDQPHVVDIPFDQTQQEIPWEERTIADRSLWNSFGDRVTRSLEPLVSEPLITRWWPKVLKFSEQTSQLGLAIAQARHRLEQSWGCRSLEIPQSRICQTTQFRRFALHLISHAARLRSDYNSALAEYRQSHNLRSPAQPLPDLAEFDGWIETPFWIWTQENPTRRALFVQPSPHGLQLSDRQQWQDTLPLSQEGSVLSLIQGAALQRLADWEPQGVKLRTRALITTLYARLLLADTFIHGIGGAKYDQVTDVLCKLFFGIELPGIVTMTGTLRLPIEHGAISPTRAT